MAEADDIFAHIEEAPPERRSIGERMRAGFAGGFGEAPLGLSPENRQRFPLWQPWQPLIAGADALWRGVPATLNAAAGLGAGLAERGVGSPAAMVKSALGYPSRPMTNAEADRLQRDLTIGGQALLAEPVMGLAAARPGYLPARPGITESPINQQAVARSAQRLSEPPTPSPSPSPMPSPTTTPTSMPSPVPSPASTPSPPPARGLGPEVSPQLGLTEPAQPPLRGEIPPPLGLELADRGIAPEATVPREPVTDKATTDKAKLADSIFQVGQEPSLGQLREAIREKAETTYEDAVNLVREAGKASTSYVQRKLKLSYSEAVDIMERMEGEGIVSPANKRGQRKVLPLEPIEVAPEPVQKPRPEDFEPPFGVPESPSPLSSPSPSAPLPTSSPALTPSSLPPSSPPIPAGLLKSGPVNPIRPLTLTQYVARNGGLPLTAETKAAGLDKVYVRDGNKRVPLARQGGRGIDEFWREHLIGETNYFNELGGDIKLSFDDILIEALKEERAGKKRFAQDDVARVDKAKRLDELAADIEKAANEILKAAEEAGLKRSEISTPELYYAADMLFRGEETDPLNALSRVMEEGSREPAREAGAGPREQAGGIRKAGAKPDQGSGPGGRPEAEMFAVRAREEGGAPGEAGRSSRPFTRSKVDEVAGIDHSYLQAYFRHETGSGVRPVQSMPLRSALRILDLSHLKGRERDIAKLYQNRLAQKAGNVPVHYITDTDMQRLFETVHPEVAEGKWVAWRSDAGVRDFILVNADMAIDARTGSRGLIHEGTHAAAYGAIETNPALKRQVKLLMDDAKQRTDPAQYGFRNEHEFVAETSSNPEFQRALDELPAPAMLVAQLGGKGKIKTLWDAFVEIMRRALDLPGSTRTMLDAALRVTEQATKERVPFADSSSMAAVRKPPKEQTSFSFGPPEASVNVQKVEPPPEPAKVPENLPVTEPKMAAFLKEMTERKAEQDAFQSQMEQTFNATGRFAMPTSFGKTWLLSKNIGGTGAPLRITFFDKDGPSGHIEVKDFAEAAKEMFGARAKTPLEEFTKAQQDYRARRIGDEEFLAARAKYNEHLTATEPKPTEEPGVEGKPQLVIPGAERVSPGTQAQRKADEGLKPKTAQKSMDIGLFGDEHKQTGFKFARGGTIGNMLHGMPISIETPKGGTRTAKDGSWKTENFPAHYGRFKGTVGADGENIDLFHDGPFAFVLDQLNAETKKFDEHKVIFANSKKDAKRIYRRAFSDGKADARMGALTPVDLPDLKDWLHSSKTRIPFARYTRQKTRQKFADGGLIGPPSQDYPTDEDVAISKRTNQMYADPSAGFAQGTGRLRDVTDYNVLDWYNKDTEFVPRISPMTPEDADIVHKQWLASERTPVAKLGFSPSRMYRTPQAELTIAGAYSPKRDQIWYDSQYRSTPIHESMHRGIQMMRQEGILNVPAKQEEMIVRALMLRHFGGLERGRGALGDEQVARATGVPGSVLDQIEHVAAEYIARKRPGGPR